MEAIEHRMVNVNGIKMHVAEQGPKDGQVVLLIHGFPDLWYTWRHQIGGLAAAGYRAVAPDLRGYGETESPGSFSEYTCHHVIGDLVELINSLGVDQVFLVGHDWGALIGWYLCQFRPDLVRAYACLSVPYRPRNPAIKPIDGLRAAFGDDYYICRFQEAGKMEEQIASSGTRRVLKKILTSLESGAPILPKENPFGVNPNQDCDSGLPSWFTVKDLDYYTDQFEKTGFTGALNYYRAMNLNWELTAPWTESKIEVPVMFMAGDVDNVYTTPGMKEYIHGGAFAADVPFLQEVVIMEGVNHFLQQEKPQETTAHLSDFFAKL